MYGHSLPTDKNRKRRI